MVNSKLQKGLDGISANMASFRCHHRKYHARHVIKTLLANNETKTSPVLILTRKKSLIPG